MSWLGLLRAYAWLLYSFIESISDMMLIDCRLEDISTVSDSRRELLSEEKMCGRDFHKRSLGANCQSLAVPYSAPMHI